MSTERLYLSRFQTFDDDENYGVDWINWDGAKSLPSPGGGRRDAALLIEVGVDGQYSLVHAQLNGVDDRAVLERAIKDLGILLAQMSRMYPDDAQRLDCIAHGGWAAASRPLGTRGPTGFRPKMSTSSAWLGFENPSRGLKEQSDPRRELVGGGRCAWAVRVPEISPERKPGLQ
ncbi:MAG: hypothetical protein ACJ72O_13935 [Marmoricola sp.]